MFQIAKLQAQLELYKLKAHRRRIAIKELIRSNELIRACWHKEIALNRTLRAEHCKDNQYFWRFAKFCYQKLNPEFVLSTRLSDALTINKLVREFEEVDKPPAKEDK